LHCCLHCMYQSLGVRGPTWQEVPRSAWLFDIAVLCSNASRGIIVLHMHHYAFLGTGHVTHRYRIHISLLQRRSTLPAVVTHSSPARSGIWQHLNMTTTYTLSWSETHVWRNPTYLHAGFWDQRVGGGVVRVGLDT
jgi:hypothetical protein